MIIYLIGGLIIVGAGVIFGGDEIIKYYNKRKRVILNRKLKDIRQDIKRKKKKKKKSESIPDETGPFLNKPLIDTGSKLDINDYTKIALEVTSGTKTLSSRQLEIKRKEQEEKEKLEAEEKAECARVKRMREKREKEEQEKIDKELEEEKILELNPNVKAGDFVTINKKGKSRRTICKRLNIDGTYQITNIGNYKALLIGESCRSEECHTAFLRKIDGDEAKYKHMVAGTCICGRDFKVNMQDIDRVLPESEEHLAINLITCDECKTKWKVKVQDMDRKNYDHTGMNNRMRTGIDWR